MANALRHNLTIPRGDDWAYELGVVNPDGQLADLTGRTLVAEVLETTQTPDTAMGVTVDGAVVTLTLPAAVTATLPQHTRWRLRQTNPGRVATFIAGRVELT